MKDRYGYTFDERCDTQRRQLQAWKALLLPEVYESTVAVCSARNRPARDMFDRQHVAVGDELAHLILAYDKHESLIEAALLGEDSTPAAPKL